jgi:23S rRNA pseudouridine2604 synthase
MSDDNTVRLVKRVAEQFNCSRNEAELYIANAFIRVDGQVVEVPGARVRPEQLVERDPKAQPLEIAPVTILLHKPAGVEASVAWLTAANLASKEKFLKKHVANLKLMAPLEKDASGLVVFTQDFRVERKLEEGVESELIVEVEGTIAPNGLQQLNQGMKASWQNERRLRFATKHVKPGLIQRLCKEVGLNVVGIKRIRLGRIPMSTLPQGQWTYLPPFERF